MKSVLPMSSIWRRDFVRRLTVLIVGATLLFVTSAAQAIGIFDDGFAPPRRGNPVVRPIAPPPPRRPAPVERQPAPARRPAAPVERPTTPAQREAPPAQHPTKPGPTVSPTPTPARKPSRTPDSVHIPPSAAPYIPPISQAAGAGKLATPDRASRAACRKLFEEVFADDLKDRSPLGRRRLAWRLYEEARRAERESADRYVLLCGMLQAAEEAYNLRMAFLAAMELAESYDVDQLATEADVATVIFNGGPSPLIGSVYNIDAMFRLADEFAAADDFANLSRVEADLQHALPSITDPELREAVISQIRDMTALIDAHEKTKPAYETLKKTPDDPTANTAIGSYLCFQRGQWDDGLGMLAKSNDPSLKALASDELNRTSQPDVAAEIGDRWWDLATKMPGPEHARILAHAMDLYRSVDASLHGLRKLAIEKRMAETPAAARPHRVDLLELFNPATGIVRGDWRMQDGALLCGPMEFSRVGFDYEPPAEYDFRISFTAIRVGGGAVTQSCYGGGHQFLYQLGGWDNKISAFEDINGVGGANNETGRKRDHWLTNGHRYTSVVKVRSTGVESYLDGQLVTSLKTDYSNVSLYGGWRLAHNNIVGIGSHDVSIRFDTVEVIEITGEGKILPP